MARFYAALLNGGELDGSCLLSRAITQLATSVFVDDEVDLITNRHIRRGLGIVIFGLPGDDTINGTDASERTFGHGGAGTCVCWADRDLDATMAYLVNGYRDRRSNVPRGRAISDAVRAAVRAVQ